MQAVSVASIAAFLGVSSLVPLPGSAFAQELIPLELYWSSNRGDNYLTASPQGGNDALQAGYVYARVDACILTLRRPETVPLNQYWSAQRGDHFITATGIGNSSARQAGYSFLRTEGYIYSSKQPGTVPLNLYWSHQREDNFTTATRQGKSDARAVGYLPGQRGLSTLLVGVSSCGEINHLTKNSASFSPSVLRRRNAVIKPIKYFTPVLPEPPNPNETLPDFRKPNWWSNP